MAFNAWEVEEDDSFSFESDPELKKLMNRKAGAGVMQDISLNTYWANTVGKTPLKGGAHHLYKKELDKNMNELLSTKMAYRQLEDFMIVLGYEVGDIRGSFQEKTGMDPVKMEHMRTETVKDTPANIPWYNLGWGWSKGKECESYFCMPHVGGLFTVFSQVSDMERKECASFLRREDALEHLKPLVKRMHCYEQSAVEQVESAEEENVNEPDKKDYRIMADYFYAQQRSGQFDSANAEKMVAGAVDSGSLTLAEGETLLKVYADAIYSGDSMPNPEHTSNTPDQGYAAELKDAQDSKRVLEETEKRTPQDFFEGALGDNIEEIATEHMKSVLTYISHRESDMTDFNVSLYKLQYLKHDKPKMLVEVDPESGKRSGPPKATISVILDVQDKTLPEDSSRKYGLCVFFVNADGDVTTSDSLKGEDDIIYGFSEDGMRQYFAKNRMSAETE